MFTQRYVGPVRLAGSPPMAQGGIPRWLIKLKDTLQRASERPDCEEMVVANFGLQRLGELYEKINNAAALPEPPEKVTLSVQENEMIETFDRCIIAGAPPKETPWPWLLGGLAGGAIIALLVTRTI